VSTSEKRDADMERLLRAVLEPAAQPLAGACPDPGLLAAFVEGNLTANEQSAVDAHIVECGRCQEALAMLADESPASGAEAVAPPETGWFTWVTRPRLRWLVPISAAATVAAVFFATRPLIAPEGDVPGTEVARMAQAPTAPADVIPAERDAVRDKSAAPRLGEPSGASERAEPERPLAAGPPAATEAGGMQAKAQAPASAPARDRRPAEPAAEMMAARVASEEKQAQQAPREPVAADAISLEAAAGKGRAAGIAGAPAKLMRSPEVNVVTVTSPDGTVLWRFGTGGRLSRSVDAGATWQAQPSGVTADLLAGSAPSPEVCWLVGASGTVLLTRDGQRWERRPFPGAADLIAITAFDARSAAVTTRDGRRYDTSDGGQTWSPQR